jgi:anti-sigma regulatory factor (Ser/Thr protein kinase)
MHTAIRLEADLGSAAVARRSVEWFAKELDVDPAVALLITTELVTNAVRHGGNPIVLHLRYQHDSLFVEVSDGDRGESGHLDVEARPDGDGGGLGLLLVEQLSRDWGVRQSLGGWKTVWAEIDCGRSEPASGNGLADARGLVASKAEHERRLADYERFLAVGERKLSEQATAEATLAPRVAALRGATGAMLQETVMLLRRVSELHDAAAAMHERAAALHERTAAMADDRARRLCDRYRR